MFKSAFQDREAAEKIKGWLQRFGYEPLHWTRVVAYRECTKVIMAMAPERLDVLEVSAGHYWKAIGYKSFTEMNYPEHDICTSVVDGQFDLIIADNVFEHLPSPRAAALNVLRMLKPGGTFMNITPFLIRYHPIPIDCTRWTETGMRSFLTDVGFESESIVTGSWGNRACVLANLNKNRWPRRGWFGSLRNEPEFPVMVWSFARRPATDV